MGKGPFVCEAVTRFLRRTKPHFNTLSTIVRGLEEKAFLSHSSFGNTYQYFALISEKEYREANLKQVIKKYFNNSYLGAVSSLVKEEKISLEELKKLIDEVDKANK